MKNYNKIYMVVFIWNQFKVINEYELMIVKFYNIRYMVLGVLNIGKVRLSK